MFKDKVIWITGAGTGIGKATAHMFAREGATLVLMGRRADLLEGVYEEICHLGGHGQTTALDVANREQVDKTAEALLGKYGRVDILVNNAGVNVGKRRLDELQPGDWDLVINVNLTGAYNMIQAVLPPMRKQGEGFICNISSIAGKMVSALAGTAYTASKHGVTGLSNAINMEEWKHNIRSTAICPGEVNTEIIDKRPVKLSPEERALMMQPEDLAQSVRFVASLPPRTHVPEMIIMPTHRREAKSGESG